MPFLVARAAVAAVSMYALSRFAGWLQSPRGYALMRHVRFPGMPVLIMLMLGTSMMTQIAPVVSAANNGGYCSNEWVVGKTGASGWKAYYAHPGDTTPYGWYLNTSTDVLVRAPVVGILFRDDSLTTIPFGQSQIMKAAHYVCDFPEYERISNPPPTGSPPVCTQEPWVSITNDGKFVKEIHIQERNRRKDGTLVSIYAVRFAPRLENALVSLLGGRTWPFIWDLTPGTQKATFRFEQLNTAKKAAIDFAVRDECGLWVFHQEIEPVNRRLAIPVRM